MIYGWKAVLHPSSVSTLFTQQQGLDLNVVPTITATRELYQNWILSLKE